MRTSRVWAGTLALALFNTLTPATAMAATEGEFVGIDGLVYRVVGGSPIYVSSWESVGTTGSQPFESRGITRAEYDAMPPVPADGAVANDGQLTYRFVGGAPIVVTNWANIGGEVTSIRVDTKAFSEAGIENPTTPERDWSRLRQRPVDGTYIMGRLPGDPEDTAVFVIAGGAPVHVSSWEGVGGPRPTTVIDMLAIRNASNGEPWYSHLNYYPADGTQINNGTTCYSVTAGAPIAQGPGTCGTRVDPAAITNAGQPGAWSHLKAPPPAPTPTPAPTEQPAVEPPPPVEPPPVIQRTIKLTPIKKQSKLKIDIGPDSATADYECIVQVRKNRKWRTVLLVMTTGPRDIKTLNLPRGKYRVQLASIGTTPGVTSASVKLRR